MRASESGQGAEEPGLVQALAGIFGCSEDVAGVIGARAVDRRFPVRAVVLRQGDRVGETYLVVAGRAHALVVGTDGQQMLLNEFGAGDIFGAVGQPALERHDADITAVAPLRTALFAAMDFLALLERHACVGLSVSRMLVRQLQVLNTRMVEEVIMSAPARVCAELLRLAEASEDGRTIRPPPVNTHLALRVHTARETVSRIIGGLERRGVIRRDPDALVIVSLRQLRDMT